MFKKREENRVDKIFKELVSIIHKKDEVSAARSLEIIEDISNCDQSYILEKIKKYSGKKNKFLDGLSAKLNRIVGKADFNNEVIKEIIDYCFRFGNAEVQQNGILLLNYYFETLKDRYRLVFLKNKKSQIMLDNLYERRD